jgi:phage-related protein
MPEEVQDEIGYGLYQAQRGLFPDAAKPLKGLSGVIEIVCDYDKNTFRAVYAVKLGDEIYVLHAFQKKSKTGIKTPKTDLELINKRLNTAKKIARGEV